MDKRLTVILLATLAFPAVAETAQEADTTEPKGKVSCFMDHRDGVNLEDGIKMGALKAYMAFKQASKDCITDEEREKIAAAKDKAVDVTKKAGAAAMEKGRALLEKYEHSTGGTTDEKGI